MKEYNPGQHFIGDIQAAEVAAMYDAQGFKKLIDALIDKHELHKVGEVYHSFENAGFTAAICLTESHISAHTWPEYGRVTFDVFLSNYENNNDGKGENIFNEISAYFSAVTVAKNIIRR